MLGVSAHVATCLLMRLPVLKVVCSVKLNTYWSTEAYILLTLYYIELFLFLAELENLALLYIVNIW